LTISCWNRIEPRESKGEIAEFLSSYQSLQPTSESVDLEGVVAKESNQKYIEKVVNGNEKKEVKHYNKLYVTGEVYL
jgi:hypothetical protein